MSPIDIVPMAPSPYDVQQYEDALTAPNGIGYKNIGFASGPTQHSFAPKPVCYTVMYTVTPNLIMLLLLY